MSNILRLTSFIFLLGVGSAVFAQSGPYHFYALTPCRIVDTRVANGTNGGPIFGSNSSRDFQIRGVCGVPAGAKAVSLNITVAQPTQPSYLTVWPSDVARPVVSMLNFEATDPSLANGLLVGLSTNTRDLSVYNNAGNVHVIIDVTGYFQ